MLSVFSSDLNLLVLIVYATVSTVSSDTWRMEMTKHQTLSTLSWAKFALCATVFLPGLSWPDGSPSTIVQEARKRWELDSYAKPDNDLGMPDYEVPSFGYCLRQVRGVTDSEPRLVDFLSNRVSWGAAEHRPQRRSQDELAKWFLSKVWPVISEHLTFAQVTDFKAELLDRIKQKQEKIKASFGAEDSEVFSLSSAAALYQAGILPALQKTQADAVAAGGE